MTISDADFPSSKAFDEIEDGLKNEADRKEFIKKANAIFAFELKNNGKVGKWYVDLKKNGEAGKGAPPQKADVTLLMDDKTFGDLSEGKGNAQKRKIKIKGNMMVATKLEQVLKSAQAKRAKA